MNKNFNDDILAVHVLTLLVKLGLTLFILLYGDPNIIDNFNNILNSISLYINRLGI